MAIASTPIQPAFEPDGAAYRAGACNIGPLEIRRRRVSGALGVAAAVALGVVFVAVGAPAFLRLAVVFPLWGGAIGLLQAQRRFCVAFAMTGVANFGQLGARPVAVGDDAARRSDRAATVRLLLDAFLIAAVGTIGFTLLTV